MIHSIFCDHTSHAVCLSISTCMCDAIQWLLGAGFVSAAGGHSAMEAPADDEQQKRHWKRQVYPFSPPWMTESVARLEEARAEALDTRKRQRAAAAAASESSDVPPWRRPKPESLPPQTDMRNFRMLSMSPASFVPQRHLFMCIGRPMVVQCFMCLPTPPSFLIRCLSKEALQHNPMVWDCTGAHSMQLLSIFRNHSESVPITLKPFFSEPLVACIHVHSELALLSGGDRDVPRARQ